MNSTILSSYASRLYDIPAKYLDTKQAVTQGSSFLDLAARVSSAQQKTDLSGLGEMQLFKKEFYEELSKIVINPTVSNAAVNISDAAFQAMKDDPEYRAQVLSLLKRDLGASFAPRNCSILITVGTSLEEYRADSWPVVNDAEFYERSADSFWERRMESHKKFMELQAEAAARRRIFMKLLQNGGTLSTSELLFDLL